MKPAWIPDRFVPMAVSDVQRNSLYTDLEGVLGPTGAQTLMALLPQDPVQLATKTGVSDLRSEVGFRFDTVDERFRQVDRRFE